jgi:hypothetical protein
MVDRGLISEFERSLSSQEGPVWFPVGATSGQTGRYRKVRTLLKASAPSVR